MVAETLFILLPLHRINFMALLFSSLNQFKCLPYLRHSIGHKTARAQTEPPTALLLTDAGPQAELFSGTVSFNPHNNVIRCSFSLSQFRDEKTKGWSC